MDFKLYASVFLVNENDGLLMVKEGKPTSYGKWNFPGGHVEEGEEYLAAAVRETLEETGVSVAPDRLLSVFVGHDRKSNHFLFLATTHSGEIQIGDENILDAQWIPLSVVKTMQAELLHPYKFQKAINAYEKREWISADVLCYAPQSSSSSSASNA